ncbi:indole-3-glycerol-phosphate synthase [Amycolatopsis roodepoortensis]|uniref:indole-3-glycerol-phosphate synthase n=1 Tax=Amycolatopsis roodepoortensis TaxID=700274 RepID=UPI00214AC55E|nr:indole-3-glycerol-phosphate synthase [Amycolatopsis roodepoortensis]UUV29036.1 indole-3-glycerol-phosphate synthase [Amycolatopsis roodepoortensis]
MDGRSLQEVLDNARLDGRAALMADVKFVSPRDGLLLRPEELEGYLAELVAGGVEAVSTPTDPVHFGGGIELAARIRALCPLPLMRKEFFNAIEQVDESADAGFDAVQLSVNTVVEPGLLERMIARSERLGLEVVVGAHEPEHVARALELGAKTIAVNNRDIVALELDTGTVSRTESLLSAIPPEVRVISESAFHTPEDVVRAVAAGADAVLVGTALAQSPDPAGLARRLRAGTVRCPT